jgi:hypothetical protein
MTHLPHMLCFPRWVCDSKVVKWLGSPFAPNLGKPNCHCHQPKDPGHGPNLRLTFKINGKTVTESLPDQPATRKAEREIAEFRRLQDLHKELIEVNAQICQLRPSQPDVLSPEKKTAEAIQKEVAREVDQLLRVRWRCARPCTTPGQPR